MPNVFISWSGKSSQAVASTLYNWLPVVLQSIRPFMSSEDLKKGGRWQADLTAELGKDSFGILCLTPSNLTAPWVLFEAGALSKSVGDAQVAPFLVGVKPSELPAPLTQFNAVNSDLEDFKRLLRDINSRVSEEAVPVDRVERSIEGLWSKIEAELRAAAEPPKATAAPTQPAVGETVLFEKFDAILQELLVLNRGQSKLLSSPDQLLPREYLENGMRRDRLPGPDHAVWGDLFEAVDDIQAVARTTGNPTFQGAATKLQEVARYLSRRLGTRWIGHRRRWSHADIAVGVDVPLNGDEVVSDEEAAMNARDHRAREGGT